MTPEQQTEAKKIKRQAIIRKHKAKTKAENIKREVESRKQSAKLESASRNAMGDVLEWAASTAQTDVLSGDQWNQFMEDHPQHRKVMERGTGQSLCARTILGYGSSITSGPFIKRTGTEGKHGLAPPTATFTIRPGARGLFLAAQAERREARGLLDAAAASGGGGAGAGAGAGAGPAADE